MQRARVVSGCGDRQIADVVGFDARAVPECAFEFAFALRVRKGTDHVFEGALGDLAGFAKFGDLVFVFDQAHLGEMRREIIVFGRRDLEQRHRSRDCVRGTGAPGGRSRAALRDSRDLLQRPAAIDAKEDLAFVEPAMPPDPQLAVDAIGEELSLSAIVFGDEEQRAVRRAFGLDDEQCARFARAHQICKVACRPESKVRVVGAHVLLARRNRPSSTPETARESSSRRDCRRASCGCAPARSGASAQPRDMKSIRRGGVSLS